MADGCTKHHLLHCSKCAEEAAAQRLRDERDTLAGLVKRLAWLVPEGHAARIVATEYLQRLGYLSPLRTDGMKEDERG